MTKINLWRLISDHLHTLVDYPNTRLSVGDAVLFFGSPVALGAVCAALGFGFKADVLIGLLTAFSIFAGLLLNLLVLVFSYTQSAFENPNPPDTTALIRRRVVREIHANVSFAILISLAVVVVATVALWVVRHYEGSAPRETGMVPTFLLVTLAANFILTMMMVLKRMHLLISNEFDRANKKRVA